MPLGCRVWLRAGDAVVGGGGGPWMVGNRDLESSPAELPMPPSACRAAQKMHVGQLLLHLFVFIPFNSVLSFLPSSLPSFFSSF